LRFLPCTSKAPPGASLATLNEAMVNSAVTYDDESGPPGADGGLADDVSACCPECEYQQFTRMLNASVAVVDPKKWAAPRLGGESLRARSRCAVAAVAGPAGE